jgi:hypothetical protein
VFLVCRKKEFEAKFRGLEHPHLTQMGDFVSGNNGRDWEKKAAKTLLWIGLEPEGVALWGKKIK